MSLYISLNAMILIMALEPTAMLLSHSVPPVPCSILRLWFPAPGGSFFLHTQGVLYMTLSCMSFRYLLRGSQLLCISHGLLSKAVMILFPAPIAHSPFTRHFGYWDFGMLGLDICQNVSFKPCQLLSSQPGAHTV